MGLGLTKPPEDLRKAFLSLDSPRDVASLLEIDYSRLIYHIRKIPESDRYMTFKIPKKSGGDREISAPATALKIIQRKLNCVLQQVFSPKPCVHGFVIDKNIVSNARMHSEKALVLGIDLEDFFPSINFGRVRGVLMAPPYRLNASVSTVLAQICCWNGRLPQGAPTSPVISNMVCARLDGELQRFARKEKIYYTRYADDLTFSTRLGRFPDSVAKIVRDEAGISIKLGDELRSTIESNKFKINESKIRLRTSHQRQEVTGLTTNGFVNVNRRFIRQIRAMIHAWKKYDLPHAERHFHERYYSKPRNPGKEKPSFKDVLKGKIEFLGMVRGKSDPIYINFLKQLRERDPTLVRGVLLDVKDALWVLEETEAPFTQGTAFMLRDYGLVTCFHVLRPTTKAFKADNPTIVYRFEVVAKDESVDLAILRLDGPEGPALVASEDRHGTEVGDSIKVSGFPNFAPGHSGIMEYGHVTGFWTFLGNRFMLISAPIIYGMSGGPVLDSRDRVVGVAARGVKSRSERMETEKQAVIPISYLRNLVSHGK